MVISPCRLPESGINIECNGVYAAYGIDALDPAQYDSVLNLKSLLMEYLFESRSTTHPALLSQMWSGYKYTRLPAAAIPSRYSVAPDTGVRCYTYTSGPRIQKIAGVDSMFKDRISFKVAPGMNLSQVRPAAFAIYLLDRGVALLSGDPVVRRSKLDQFTDLLHRVEPGVVLAAVRAATDQSQSNLPANSALLRDLSEMLDQSVEETITMLGEVLLDSAKLRPYLDFSLQSVAMPTRMPEPEFC